MSITPDDFCDCDIFDFGDLVRSRINPHLTGMIIGESDWGNRYQVRLADGAQTIWWFAIEIEHDPDAPPPDDGNRQDDDTNIVRVDFTRRRVMTIKTTTEGAA